MQLFIRSVETPQIIVRPAQPEDRESTLDETVILDMAPQEYEEFVTARDAYAKICQRLEARWAAKLNL